MKYVVHGSVMEYMAVLHTIASSEREALEKWTQAFTAEQRGSMTVRVWECSDEDRWEHDGYTFYSGGYQYHV